LVVQARAWRTQSLSLTTLGGPHSCQYSPPSPRGGVLPLREPRSRTCRQIISLRFIQIFFLTSIITAGRGEVDVS
jgi:hypothetical protein